MPTAFVILAAGLGTRMNSDRPKALHVLAGVPLLHHALTAAREQEPDRIIVVAGHGADAVTRAAHGFDEAVQVVDQAEQLGTGHAVLSALPALRGFAGRVIVLYADTPFISADTLERMAAAAADVTVLGFEPADPARYGRLVMSGERLERIVEWKDATEAERAIGLCNSGVLAAGAGTLAELLPKITNRNAVGEYYLTDLVALARTAGLSANAVICPEAETIGINSRADLARAEAMFQTRARVEAMEAGVTLTDPSSVHFALDTHIGRDTHIAPHVVFGPGVSVESGARIEAFCHLEGCHVSEGASVGPFARLRPGAELAEGAHVGNFVEIKNAVLGEGAKVGHLTYLGDAEVGAGANIGAGTITCNYDGVAKHRTVIGARAFIGSATMLVAPLTVGDGAMTGSGSVITEDVPAGAMAVGRAAQINKPGAAARFMAVRRAAKAGTEGA